MAMARRAQRVVDDANQGEPTRAVLCIAASAIPTTGLSTTPAENPGGERDPLSQHCHGTLRIWRRAMESNNDVLESRVERLGISQ